MLTCNGDTTYFHAYFYQIFPYNVVDAKLKLAPNSNIALRHAIILLSMHSPQLMTLHPTLTMITGYTEHL